MEKLVRARIECKPWGEDETIEFPGRITLSTQRLLNTAAGNKRPSRVVLNKDLPALLRGRSNRSGNLDRVWIVKSDRLSGNKRIIKTLNKERAGSFTTTWTFVDVEERDPAILERLRSQVREWNQKFDDHSSLTRVVRLVEGCYRVVIVTKKR